MQTTWILFSQRERERERERCENCKRPSLSTKNEAEFSYSIQQFYPLIAEKYKVAIQYRLIKAAWQHWQEVYALLNVIWSPISVCEWCVWIKIERWLNWTVLIYWPYLSHTQWCSVWSHCIAVVQEMFERWRGGGRGYLAQVVNQKNKKWHAMPKRLPKPRLWKQKNKLILCNLKDIYFLVRRQICKFVLEKNLPFFFNNLVKFLQFEYCCHYSSIFHSYCYAMCNYHV